MNAIIFWLALLLIPLNAAADELPASDTFILEIRVDGREKQTVSLVKTHDNAMWMDANDLKEAGIAISPDEIGANNMVNISKLSGMHVTLVPNEQKLLIAPEPQRLSKQVFNLHPDNGAPTTDANSGLIGRYDFTATVDDIDHAMASSGTGMALSGTYFTPSANYTLNGFAETNSQTTRYVRLDTMVQFDNPEDTQRLLVGDAISGGPSWARSLRFAGFQMATDFSLRPDLATMPLPDFFGQSTVPATVDVFVNSAKVFETHVESGPFEINNLPVLTGGGQANVVVRDVLGRETTASLPFFATEAMLRKDLEAYDLNIGFVRGSYGQRSFDYGKPIASGTYRYGVTNNITLDAHLEASGNAQVAGGGASFSVSPYGIVNIATAISNHTSEDATTNGALTYASFESQIEPFGFFGSASMTYGDYTDIASSYSGKPSKLQLQLGGNVSFNEYGSLSASWIESKRVNTEAVQFASLSYKLAYNEHWNFSVTSFYDVGNNSAISEAVATYVFDDGAVGNSSISHGRYSNQKQLSYTKPPNTNEGFGYGVSTSLGEMQLGEASAMWIGPKVHMNGGIATRDGMQAARFNATGGLIEMDGSVYTTAPPEGDAVALVKTGQPNATIFLENRPITKTDEDGEALITGLVPYIPNKVAINPAEYKMSSIIESSEKKITPRRESGVLVDFTPEQHHPAIVVVQMEDKSYAPAGAKATLDNSTDPLVVGRHGEIFIRDLKQGLKGTVSYGGDTCNFELTTAIEALGDAIPRIGPLVCTKPQPSPEVQAL